ncbi:MULTISPECIES: septation ring formation regulator EzrA [Ligilactobacillus]|uniref:Septation ring formation regulator EzrA n=1 Tax=Ligilactobacillus salivarius TaxID=1624 RepID=A0AAX3X2L1_9LACO|nr:MULTISPECIES: septation ring formation regulator EzrA [Ligilactobacillus]MBE7386579.1 septation ring formation regulator EzrA [Ligilactobacillus salivarius]MBE7391019.1 septation ring formation regulator EzrA [Ligilactobacillus salivarius]MCZ0744388.1 septation ring formation regulator EzrA [Ligilactobacillus sp. UO.C109]MDF4187783.1 septation ring formation regulator EzrA [Ligilactobacillus salivarius]MDF4191140.1 septation ring formation regulator EzrA [Ligilactobacillus salivarius]
MVLFFVVIVAVAIGIYVGVIYFQRSFRKQINEYQTQLEELSSNTLDNELNKIEKLHLTGESLREFEELKKSHKKLTNREMPEISEMILDLNDLNERYKFMQERSELLEVGSKLQHVKEETRQLEEAVNEMKEKSEEHQKAVTELKDKYRDIRKTLLAKNFSFGPSIDKLEENLSKLEEDFDKYAKLTESGDFVTSDKPLNQLKEDTASMERDLEVIPGIYKNLKNVFPDQLSELRQGVAQMQDEGFAFDKDILGQLKDLAEQCSLNNKNLKELRVDNAKVLDEDIANKIDAIYETLEEEYKAKIFVQKKISTFGKFIEHAEKQEKNLLLDLDRLKQNYTLNHDEIESAQGLADRLKGIRSWYDQFIKDAGTKAILYSSIAQRIEIDMQALTDIEKKQKEINDSVASLWKEEREAQNAVKNFDLEIHKMKREIEKLNLPGLSDDYLDYFFKVSDEIEKLDKDLNRVQINMDEITKSLINTQSDLDILGEKTDELISSSILTEEILQYSNRYRNRYPDVAAAYNQAVQLFEKEYEYVKALDTISHAVDKVQEGASKKIMEEYSKNHPPMFSK